MNPKLAAAARFCGWLSGRCERPTWDSSLWRTILISGRQSIDLCRDPGSTRNLRGHRMSRPLATVLVFTFLSVEAASAQPPVRKFDDPGSPTFKVLKTG